MYLTCILTFETCSSLIEQAAEQRGACVMCRSQVQPHQIELVLRAVVVTYLARNGCRSYVCVRQDAGPESRTVRGFVHLVLFFLPLHILV